MLLPPLRLLRPSTRPPQDPLQRLHTLHNLHITLAASSGLPTPAPEANGANPPAPATTAGAAAAAAAAVPRTLRDHTLLEGAAAIRRRYLEQRRTKLLSDEVRYWARVAQ
jgi:E3 ubiquitin-protein ligase SHPRH